MLSASEREDLLRVAREALQAHFAGRDYRPHAASQALAAPRAAFVSLHERDSGELRGCIGSLTPSEPLVEAVAEAAVAAATRDGRFAPAAAEELPGLRLQVSVLEPMHPIKPEQVQVGVHGLVVRYAGRSGLLLPQVAPEHGWDRERLLRGTCHKAGLPEDAWQKPGCELLAFEAEVFGE